MMGGVEILLILGTLQGFLSQTIHVSQIIPVIFTPEGSSVALPCNYSISGAEDTATTGSYKWYRHGVRMGPEVSDSNRNYTGRISGPDTTQFIYSRSAGIVLHRAEVSDSGMYYCEVTFQHGGEISGHGNGTFLNVTDKSDLSLMVIPLGVTGVVFMAALSLAGYWCLTKQAARSSHQVDPIIYTDFSTQERTHNGVQSPALLQQSMEDAHYTMDNSHYSCQENTQSQYSPDHQELNLYSVIPEETGGHQPESNINVRHCGTISIYMSE